MQTVKPVVLLQHIINHILSIFSFILPVQFIQFSSVVRSARCCCCSRSKTVMLWQVLHLLPPVFIAAQLVSLPVFILVCTLFCAQACFAFQLRNSTLVPMVMMTLTCQFNYRKNKTCCTRNRNESLSRGPSLQALKMTGDISLPPVGVSVQILPLWQNALNFKSIGH